MANGTFKKVFILELSQDELDVVCEAVDNLNENYPDDPEILNLCMVIAEACCEAKNKSLEK